MMLEPFSAIVAFFLYIDSHPVDHFKDALSVLGFKLLYIIMLVRKSVAE